MKAGCYTALVTPFTEEGVDYEGLDQLVEFQINNGVTGVLAAGTTGESPVFAWEEHNLVVEKVAAGAKDRCVCIAGAGSNNTSEALLAVRHARDVGVDAVLLVDPYYNGPSSLEIRREYIEPVAQAFPDLEIIPYIIPGRTGAKMLPEDLALVYNSYKNVRTVKEATGDIENMKRTRACCGSGYTILSGDDSLVFKMMTDPEILASGVISVVSNIIPGKMSELVSMLIQGNIGDAQNLIGIIQPLFGLVTVTTKEITPYGEVDCRARNPLAIKTLMRILGMPSGKCRRPLGLMSKNGVDHVLGIAQSVHGNDPEIFRPIADYFGVDIDERLGGDKYLEGLYYTEY